MKEVVRVALASIAMETKAAGFVRRCFHGSLWPMALGYLLLLLSVVADLLSEPLPARLNGLLVVLISACFLFAAGAGAAAVVLIVRDLLVHLRAFVRAAISDSQARDKIDVSPRMRNRRRRGAYRLQLGPLGPIAVGYAASIVAVVALLLRWPFSRLRNGLLLVLTNGFFLFVAAIFATTLLFTARVILGRFVAFFAAVTSIRKPGPPHVQSAAEGDGPSVWDPWLDGF